MINIKPNLHFVSGGLGKNIAFTAILKKLHEKFKNKICISSPWPLVFNQHPSVAKQTPHSASILNDLSFIYYKKYKNIFYHEPYNSNFLKGEQHIIDSYAEYYEINDYEKLPDFYINLNLEKKLKQDIIKLNKFILVQFNGSNEFSGRDYAYGQEVISQLRKKFPFVSIVNFGLNEQNNLIGCTRMPNESYEAFMIYAKYCSTFISIDSSLMHMCSNKSFNKKGICLWGISSPKQFGYEKNINLLSNYPNANEIEPNEILKQIEKLINLN